jgi:hypothetical protein
MSVPAEIRLEACPGTDSTEKWKVYLDLIYKVFLKEIIDGGLQFNGLPVRCRYEPPCDDKHAGFWHLITEGPIEANRTPDLERCARIRWISWIIANANNPAVIRCWENIRPTDRGSKTRIPLWFVEGNFAVILEKRPGYFLLITSYCVRPHQAEKFEKEWRAWEAKKAETA